MLCVPAEAPEGRSRGSARAQTHTSTRRNGRCAPSEPQLHTRSMQVHEETRSTHGGRILLQRQGGSALLI